MLLTGRELSAGELLRYPAYSTATYQGVASQEYLEPQSCAHRNFYWTTYSPPVPHRPIVRLERGINSMLGVRGPEGVARKPALLLRTSSYKAGTETTPWHDEFDIANQRLIYFGDMRPQLPFEDPADAPGNKVLLTAANGHGAKSPAMRALAHPLLYFTAQQAEGRQNGHVRFEGVLHITSASLVRQPGVHGETFANYRFEMKLMPLDQGRLGWDWILARWDQAFRAAEALRFAPESWRRWVETGTD